MYLIDKDRLVDELAILQPRNNYDVPKWVWNVIDGQPEVSNVTIISNNRITLNSLAQKVVDDVIKKANQD